MNKPAKQTPLDQKLSLRTRKIFIKHGSYMRDMILDLILDLKNVIKEIFVKLAFELSIK